MESAKKYLLYIYLYIYMTVHVYACVLYRILFGYDIHMKYTLEQTEPN